MARPWRGTRPVYGGNYPSVPGSCMSLFEPFRKFLNCLCQSAVSKSSITKWCCTISMLLATNSPDLYVFTLCVMFGKNNLFLARLPGVSANSNEIIGVITSSLLLTFPQVSRKSPEVLNFRKIYNPMCNYQHILSVSVCGLLAVLLMLRMVKPTRCVMSSTVRSEPCRPLHVSTR